MADFDTELASMALEQERTQQEILRHVQLLHQSMNNLVDSMQRQEQKLFELQVATNTVLENTKPVSNCAFCEVGMNSDKHDSNQCTLFPDPVSRTVQAIKLGLCEKCLKKHSGEVQCRTICIKCKGPHHLTLCNKKNFPFSNKRNRQY